MFLRLASSARCWRVQSSKEEQQEDQGVLVGEYLEDLPGEVSVVEQDVDVVVAVAGGPY